MSKLLIVDDEEKIRDMIEKYASREGYDVFCAKDGYQAIEICKSENIDVIIMDIMMPGMDGYKTYQHINEIKKDIPCIFLSALNQEEDRIYGFDVGGVDYVSKPFSPKELMMRLKVALKRQESSDQKVLRVEGLVLDEGARSVKADGVSLALSLKEYELLYYLMSNAGIALRREDILSKVWGYDDYSDDRTLDTHIKLLRKVLGDYARYIVTIRGVGYRFEKEIES